MGRGSLKNESVSPWKKKKKEEEEERGKEEVSGTGKPRK